MAREVEASVIKRKYPDEWALLQERVQAKSKPDLPRTIRESLKKRARVLLEGRFIKFGPTATYPFVAKCRLIWEEDRYSKFEEIVDYTSRPGASQYEKKILKLIDGQYIYDTIYEAVERSPAAKAYDREITAFCKEGEALEKKYAFCFQDLLESIIW